MNRLREQEEERGEQQGGVGAFGVDESDGQHGRKIDDHGQQNPEIVGQLRHLPNHDAKRLPPWQNYVLICVLICD